MNITKKTVLAGMFVALGVLMPIGFHFFLATGPVFLPMHIPVLAAGIVLGPVYGGIVGILSCVISSFATGMPVFAKLPFMAVELFCYGAAAGICSYKNLNVYLTLVISIVFGRIIYGIMLTLGMLLFGLHISPAVMVISAFITGLPGIALQIILVPAIVFTVKKGVKAYD